jgi:hypothetical protein
MNPDEPTDNYLVDLRDHFAALAMHADMMSGLHADDFADTAARAYRMADTMLRAREANE